MKLPLYIHIPFCISKCDYCDFFSKPCSEVPDNYIAALEKEIEWYRSSFSIEGWSSVYIGGRTPGLMNPDQIRRLMGIISRNNPWSLSGMEVTMEMNPESITEEKLLVMAQEGVSRLSVGIQSLNDSALSQVHRHCTAEKAEKALETIKKVWHGKLNLDSIAGLPGQSEDEFLESLKRIVSWEPDHVSLYTLTVEDGTPLEKNISRGMVQFEEENADSQWLKGRDFLEKAGYIQYEVSNFSRPGCESRHNMFYWSQESYIGAGSGATGTLYDFCRKAESQESGKIDFSKFGTDYNRKGLYGLRWTNTENIQSYIDYWTCGNGHLPFPAEFEELDLETLEFECLMMCLRTVRGINKDLYESRYSRNLEDRLGVKDGYWDGFKKEGRTVCYEDSLGSTYYALNKEGLLYLNLLLRNYLT